MKRGDLMLIAVLLLAVGLFMIPRWFGSAANEKAAYAQITVNGELYRKVELTKEEQVIEIHTDSGYNKLKIHDHGVVMTEADCPDKVCVDTGFRKRKGETIVCLPHRIIVEVMGDGVDESEIDAVAN